MIKCDNCGHENPDDAKLCYRCQAFLDPDKVGMTEFMDDTDYEEPEPRWGVARLTGSLILDVEDIDKRFVIPASDINEFILGRQDPHSGEAPQIDLTAYGALDKGVSRQHAFIKRVERGVLAVIDNASPNGTYLNGQRLVPQQPRILRDGDVIRLGHLSLNVIFEGLVAPIEASDSQQPNE
ncbi:MAG: FHA domain-containing protein [Anaerolineae bacterium]|nr:FHA domain-containing protein [Anaerolineae bacterium]